jgi:hypothetical protein
MSQFSSLWRIFTGGHLQKLLEQDYPDTNLPCQVLTRSDGIRDLNEHLEGHYMLVGVVYRKKMADHLPGVFRNPVAPDTQAYAQAMVFVPRRRLIKVWVGPGGFCPGGPSAVTGVPGQGAEVGGPPAPPRPPPAPPPPGDPDDPHAAVVRQSARTHPQHWTLVNQNWTTQLVPATSSSIPRILSTPPYGSYIPPMDTPDLSGITSDDFLWLSNH